MATSNGHDYLSFGDALFLYLEREGTPLNIASVAVFDGVISLEELSSYLESKLPHIPRYLQRVVMPPFNIGLPTWEFDPDFDIGNHIRELSLKRGTEAELKIAASAILSSSLDRRRPLWDFTLVQGLKRNRTGLVVRVQHCLADGLSGIGLLNTLLDPTPNHAPIVRRKIRIPVPPQKDLGTQVIESALYSWFSAVERVLTTGNELLTMAQQLVAGAQSSGASDLNGLNGSNGMNGSSEASPHAMSGSTLELARLLPEISGLPERLPFNVLCRGPQRFEWTQVSLSELKAIKDACGTKFNDVVLTLLTATFRQYAESRGVDVTGRELRIVVPVNTRREHNVNDIGNHITFTPVSTPLDVANPTKLLAAVHEKMQSTKAARVPHLVALAGTLMGTIPSPLQAMLAPVLSELPISLCNTICTNVPGPQFPLYLLGHKMLHAYPYVPIGGEMGINCAVLTYNGKAFFGFTGDAHAAPDLQQLPTFLEGAMDELRAATGIRVEKKRVGRKKAKQRPKEEPASAPSTTVAAPADELMKTVAAAGNAA